MEQIYRKGEYVRYASNGVCLIEDIRSDSPKGKGKEFYVLKPVGAPGSTIFVPLDNETLLGKMGRLPTREEVDQLILSTRDGRMAWVDNRKDRTALFQTLVKTSDLEGLMGLAGCIFQKKQELLAKGKKLSAADESILRRAEGLIENELAFVLCLPLDQVRGYIQTKLNAPVS